MKKMIRMAMVAAAMFMVVATVAKAQGGGGRRGGGRGPNVMALLDSVKATDAQKAQADSIVKSFQALNAPLMEAARGGDADARTKMMENRQKQNDAIKAILTDDQKAAWDKIMASMPQRGGRPPVTL